jgi:hypothetical protein
MGLDLPSVQLLCCARSIGVDFSETLMIGRQTINEDSEILAPALSAIGISSREIQTLKRGEFGEALFHMLGAKKLQSIDASDYEQATHIHDLNQPCPLYLSQKFSVVHDGGTLEHVFNIAQAFKTTMEMVRLGGHFIQVNVANNYMGHGFWQFSPETIYRTFSPENGFLTKIVLLHEVTPGGAWYRVSDPAIGRERVELVNDQPTYICTIAQRVVAKELFDKYPQQSDYIESWKRPHIPHQRQSMNSYSIRQMIPQPFKRLVRSALNAIRNPSPFDRPYYLQIAESDLIQGRIGM